jgi:LAS superfamily LD-carboxypeptidase LdcB
MFSTQEAFKRNRNYYDVLKINEQEHYNEKKRRKPNLLKVEASTRIESTFQSAKKEIKHKVEEDIEKFKFRLSFYNSEDNP